MKKIFLTALLTICTLLSTSNETALAAGSGLSITPATVELLLSPNKKVTQAFTINNQGESGNFVANLHTFSPTDNLGHGTVSPSPLDPTKVPLMLKLENADLALGIPFTLSAGESRQLVLSLEAPSGDTIFDTYLSLVITPVSSTLEGKTTATAGLGSLILTTVTPDGVLPIKLEVEDLTVPALHDSNLPLSVSPSIANHGPSMLRFSGKLSITSPQGQEVFQLPLYNNTVLKDSKRIILGTNQSGDTLPLTWQPHINNIGPYIVKLSIQSVGGTTIQEVERSVWLLPLRVVALTLIAVTLLLLLIYLKKLRHKNHQKYPESSLDKV